MSEQQKVCAVCGDDVAAKKRVKDQQGRYYCAPCHAKRGVGANVAATVANAPALDEYDLAPVKEPEVKTPMFACARCNGLVSERQIRNVDGEFICGRCFAGSGAPVKSAAKKPARAEAREATSAEATGDGARFTDTIVGGLLVAAVVMAVGFVVNFALGMKFPVEGQAGVGYAVAYGMVMTVFLVIEAGVMMLSMIVAGKIVGGINFGFLGAAIYKTLALMLAFSILDFFVNQNENLFMLGFGFRAVLFALGFMLVFKLDLFEGVILSVVNVAMGWGMMIVLGIIVMQIGLAASHIPHSGDPGPAHETPEMPDPGAGGAGGE